MNDDGFSVHLVEYQFEGKSWMIEVPARSFEEAEQRLAVAGAWGKCIGSHAQRLPAVPGAGLWVRLLCWWRNLWSPA